MRWLLVLLVVLAAACGDGGSSSSGGGLSVDVAYDDPLRVGPVTWEVTVTNGTDDPVDLEFTSGQRADVTLTRDGEEVYRWSRGLMFTQDLATVTVPEGGAETFPLEEPGLDVDPGDYRLTASVTVSNRKLSVERQVTVEPMRR